MLNRLRPGYLSILVSSVVVAAGLIGVRPAEAHQSNPCAVTPHSGLAVHITSPRGGATINLARTPSFSIAGYVHGATPEKVVSVQLYADGVAIATPSLSRPFLHHDRLWNAKTSATPGRHTILACARTSRGAVAAASIPIQVNAPAPTATMTAPDEVTVSSGDLAAVTAVSDTSVTFRRQPTSFAVGKVITAGITAATPNGLMRRVRSITRSGGKYVVKTVPATLDEVFWQADIVLDGTPLEPADTRTTQGRLRAQATTRPVNFNQSFTLKDAQGREFTAKLSESFQSSLDFHLKISPHWAFGSLVPTITVDEFLFKVAGKVTGGFDVSIGKKFSAQKIYQDVLRVRMTPILLDALPPIVIVPYVSLDVKIAGSVTAELSGGVAGTATVAAGFDYRDKTGFQNLSNASTSGEMTTVFNGGAKFTGTASVGVVPAVTGYIDGLIGPKVSAELGLEVQAANPCGGKVSVGLYAELKATGSINLFEKELEYDIAATRASIELWQHDIWGCDLDIETDHLPDGEVGKEYTAELKATGGVKDEDADVDEPEYVWDATGLPDGLVLSDEGKLSGKPASNGTYPVEFSVADQSGDTFSKTIPITVTGGLRITTSSLPEGTEQVGYAATLAATNGNGTLTWSLAGGGLPAGLTLNDDGTISGTPGEKGSSDFTVKVTDADGKSATASLTLVVGELPDPADGTPADPVDLPACTTTCGTTWGDPHLITFDGARYDFQQAGEFVAVKSTGDDFQIQVRQEPWNGSRTVAVNVAAAYEIAGHRVAIYAGNPLKVTIDGQPATLTGTATALPGGGSIVLSAPSVPTVRWPDGTFVSADGTSGEYLTLALSLADARRGHITGLLGNADGSPDNDLTTRDGVVLPPSSTGQALYGDYSASWRIKQAESLFDYATGQDTGTFTDLAFPYGYVDVAGLPEANRQAAIAACQAAGIQAGPTFDACVLDVAMTGDVNAATAAATAQAAVNGGVKPGPTCDAEAVAPNDDGSSPEIALPFEANFFGRKFGSVWVNNNGNLTFDGPSSQYTPGDLATMGSAIVAGWWADVDTQGEGSDPVRYGTGKVGGRTAFCATYSNVGYYSAHADKLNSFQIYLVDRSDVAPGAFDIVMQYQKLQWETGDASGGSNGLGGNSAVVGYSNGDGKFLQVPGSGVPGSLLDGAPGSLVTGSQPGGQPGIYTYEIR